MNYFSNKRIAITNRNSFLLASLFVRPSYNHYYFGDYYGSGYDRLGFVPWTDFRYGRRNIRRAPVKKTNDDKDRGPEHATCVLPMLVGIPPLGGDLHPG
jgi:hypothetical protein